MMDSYKYDFAISYAGEDFEIANEIAHGLKERYSDFTIFLAPKEKVKLIGTDGETFFEKLFTEAKQVIVLISKHYKAKLWTRYEWDIILERKPDNRYIPIKLDNTKILGLPFNIIYETYKKENLSDLIKLCIQKLLVYEKNNGINRLTDFEKNLNSLKYDSKGSLSKAYQLVVDNRKRTPLNDLKIPNSNYTPTYVQSKNDEWYNFSVIKRLVSYITVPKGLSEEELIFNLKYCAIVKFNKYKPDALKVFASCLDIPPDIYEYNAGNIVLAPFGEWGKAEEGFAYNIPSEEFEFYFDIRPKYLEYK